MTTPEPLGLPPYTEAFPGVDRLGGGCRISPSASVFRAPNRHPEAGIAIGRDAILFDGVRLLLGEVDVRLEIGDRVIINTGGYISGEGGLRIADDVIIGPHVRILSAGHAIHGGDPVVWKNAITYGPIDIGRGAWIGAGATILQGVSVGAGAVVGAASVVTRDIPPFAVVVGNPARIVNYRLGHAATPVGLRLRRRAKRFLQWFCR